MLMKTKRWSPFREQTRAEAALVSAGAQPYGAYYGYGPSYYYAPAPVYYGPGPGCFLRNQRVWDGYAWRIQRVQVCN